MSLSNSNRATPHRSILARWAIPLGALLACEIFALAGLYWLLPLREWSLQLAIPVNYFEPELDRADEFEQISGPVYAFRHGIDRSVVVDSGEGLAVFDTFSEEHCRLLNSELRERFPGQKVRWVFYSHSHLDHISGAAVLEPSEVIAHRKVMQYVADWPAAKVLPVTRAVEGDVDFMLGKVPVHLLYLGEGHTDTLYAYHFPQQRAVFAPDAAFVHSLPPFGMPATYYPGYLRALDRLSAVDFDALVTSHFARGEKADVAKFRQLMVDFRAASAAVVLEMGGNPSRGVEQRARIGAAYRTLKAKYGAWHGFEEMFIPHFLGGIGGAYLGY
jgi:glyoxylase-like metal-dependent hydrolase (beta-lactamase superfamily II)